MAIITLNTLRFVERLRAAGVSEPHAKAEAEALAEVFGSVGQDLVTRDYLDARLKATKTDLMKWIAGMLIAQAALIATLIKLLGM